MLAREEGETAHEEADSGHSADGSRRTERVDRQDDETPDEGQDGRIASDRAASQTSLAPPLGCAGSDQGASGRPWGAMARPRGAQGGAPGRILTPWE